MPHPVSILTTAIAMLLLSACQSESPTPQAAANTPTAASSKASAPDDPCGHWLSTVKSMCTDFVEGRAVTGSCATQSINLRTAFSQQEMQDPAISPSLCNAFLRRLDRELESAPTLTAATLGEECTSFGQKVKSDCIDTLGTPGDAMTCNAKLTMVATARNADEEKRESACKMGRLMYAN